MMIAASCSKNFGLYRDRVGVALALSATPEASGVTKANLATLNRLNFSFPPDHGAKVVSIILNDAELRADWMAELEDMRQDMLTLRTGLADALRRETNSDRFDFIADHRGMFSRLGLGPDQVAALRADHGIYMVGDSRVNIAGLPREGLDRIARAMVATAASGRRSPTSRPADVEHLLDWTTVADAIAEGHRAPRPAIGDTFLTRGDDTLLSRAAWIDGMGVAVKSVTVLPGNPARGLASVNGAMVLFEDSTGLPVAVIDSALVTKWKTAGDSVLGARLLARPDSATAADRRRGRGGRLADRGVSRGLPGHRGHALEPHRRQGPCAGRQTRRHRR